MIRWSAVVIFIAITIFLLWCIAPTFVIAAACTGMPRWLGFNVNGVLEYCGTDNQVHALALGDAAGSVPGVATPVPTLAPPTPQPTYAYTAPTPVPTSAPMSAVYDPATLAANASRCDTVAVTGIVTTRPVVASPGTDVAVGCVIASVRPSGTNQVAVCWRNAFAATTQCNTASSTWLFTQ